MKKKFLHLMTLIAILCSNQLFANNTTCSMRTFIMSTNLTTTQFQALNFANDLPDSTIWHFGDGTIQVGYGTSGNSLNHTYVNAGTYIVTVEQWGHDAMIANDIYHCTYSDTNVVMGVFTDSICGISFKTHFSGDTVTFSNTSSLMAPGYLLNTNGLPLWDFGNGGQGPFINRIYPVIYNPGTYTACLNYDGFSFNNGGYNFHCQSCTTFTIGPNAVIDLDKPDLTLYPNPVNNQLHISSVFDMQKIEIQLIDILGNISIPDFVIKNSNELILNTSNLKSGLYYVRINLGKEIKVFPISKIE